MMQSVGRLLNAFAFDTVGGVDDVNFMNPSPKQPLNELAPMLAIPFGIVIDARE